MARQSRSASLVIASFFCSQTRCLAVSDPVCSIQYHFSVKYHLYLGVRSFRSIQIRISDPDADHPKGTQPSICWYISWNRKRPHSAFDNGKLEDLSRNYNQLVVLRQVVTTPCCGLVLIFCGFILHLIGHETINIPHIFSGYHGFTGKTTARWHLSQFCLLPIFGKFWLWSHWTNMF